MSIYETKQYSFIIEAAKENKDFAESVTDLMEATATLEAVSG